MTMVRKQYYIEEDDDEYIKRRARELGKTEAGVIRDLIKRDSLQSNGQSEPANRLKALMLKRRAALPNGGGTEKFDRESLYER